MCDINIFNWFIFSGSRASETGSEMSQSHSTSSLDREDDDRLRQVSIPRSVTIFS